MKNSILETLRQEKNYCISGGLYHELQVSLTYNSNHIEGNRLSEEQTRMIFETNSVGVSDCVGVDDIIETVNHFRAVDYVIDVAEAPLSEDIIKHLHLLIKQCTKDSNLSWFAVGDYKKRGNFVGGIETAPPKKVPVLIKALLQSYEEKEQVNFEDIVGFHYEFEKIHPFQDGNGRVGRLIAFKECLRHNIVPFIIEDSKKIFYYRGLSEWNREKGYLLDTCRDGQDTLEKLINQFNITKE